MKNIPPEEWRPVVGYEGHYDVSSHGRVRSLKWGKTRIRKVSRHESDGHRFLMLSKGSCRRQFVVARLVLLAFVGPPPSPKHVACHDKGGNRNDYLWRLRWDTVAENNRDTVRHGTYRTRRGRDAPSAKLDDVKVLTILRRLAAGESQNVLAGEYGLTQGNLSRIKNCETWTHIPRPAGLPTMSSVRARKLTTFSVEELATELRRRGDPKALEFWAADDLRAELARREAASAL